MIGLMDVGLRNSDFLKPGGSDPPLSAAGR